MERLVASFVYLLACIGGVVFLAVLPGLVTLLLLEPRQSRKRTIGLFIASAIAAGFFAGAALSWGVIPFRWNMPFWKTLAISLNAEKYGHTMEHRAESILIWVLFSGVSGGIIAGMLAAAGVKLRAGKAVRVRFGRR